MLSLTQQGEKKRRRIMSMWLESESKQEDVMKKLQAMVWTSWVYIGRHPDLNVPQLYPEFNLEELSIIEGWIKSSDFRPRQLNVHFCDHRISSCHFMWRFVYVGSKPPPKPEPRPSENLTEAAAKDATNIEYDAALRVLMDLSARSNDKSALRNVMKDMLRFVENKHPTVFRDTANSMTKAVIRNVREDNENNFLRLFYC